MTIDRKSWRRKFQVVKNAWHTYRPGEEVEYEHLHARDFGVTFFRSLTDTIEVRSEVTGWQFEALDWFLRVRVGILDRRAAEFLSGVLTNYDASDLSTLDFDVLAAAAAIEGRELEPAPLVEPPLSDDAARLLVKEFSDKVDLIWRFAGGFTVGGLETLSIWLMRNRIGVRKIPPAAVFRVVCTAFVYGERELSRELLREYEMFVEKRRRIEVVSEETRAIHAALSENIARLRRLLSPH